MKIKKKKIKQHILFNEQLYSDDEEYYGKEFAMSTPKKPMKEIIQRKLQKPETTMNSINNFQKLKPEKIIKME